MKKAFPIMMVMFLAAVVIMACAAQYVPSPAAAAPINRPQGVQPVLVMTPSPTGSPTQDAEMAARATMLFLQATDTAVAAEKTEMANLATNQAYIQETQDRALVMTHDAQSTSVMSTAIATITQIEGTKQATQTQGAATAGANATSTSLAMTQTIEMDKLNATRFGIWSIVIMLVLAGILGLVGAVVYFGTKVYGIWLEQKARNLQDSKIEPDQNGRYAVIPASALPGKTSEKIVNPNLAHRAVTYINSDDLSTEQALANAQSHRDLESIRALVQSVSARKMLGNGKPPTLDPAALPNAGMTITKPELGMLPDGMHADWNTFRNWDGRDGIPYGVSQRGLETVSLQQVPHGGVFGKTGTGKSRGFLRPFIAGALASGQRVVIIGKEVDFWPFAQHPNVKMIGVRNITDENEAARYADYLKRIVQEMNRRDGILTSRRVATWDRAGFENTLLILDELGNALDMMPNQIRQEAHRWVGGLVREGRKYGFNVWLATQRAVGFKSIVEQLGRAVFYLADADASRHALGFPGAEKLTDGQFFAKFQRTQICAAFDPTDEELVSFLGERNVPAHEPINWIDGHVVGEKAEEAVNAIDAKIIKIWKEMKAEEPLRNSKVSMAKIQREVYRRQIPTDFYNVRDVINKYQQEHPEEIRKMIQDYQRAQGTTTTGDMPDSEPLPA